MGRLKKNKPPKQRTFDPSWEKDRSMLETAFARYVIVLTSSAGPTSDGKRGLWEYPKRVEQAKKDVEDFWGVRLKDHTKNVRAAMMDCSRMLGKVLKEHTRTRAQYETAIARMRPLLAADRMVTDRDPVYVNDALGDYIEGIRQKHYGPYFASLAADGMLDDLIGKSEDHD